jgi:hypothetical protein
LRQVGLLGGSPYYLSLSFYGLLLKPPGANIKEFLLTNLSEAKRPQI